MLLASHGSLLAGADGGFLLLRLNVASPEDLTDPSVAERLMHQVSRHSLCRGVEKSERVLEMLGKICRIQKSCCYIREGLVFCGREGNGTPLQYSCLENPMGGGAWFIYACVQDLVFHYWADRDLRVAFSTHPESQASS